MTQYLLSVHSVEGEVSAPPTDEQMQQFDENVKDKQIDLSKTYTTEFVDKPS